MQFRYAIFRALFITLIDFVCLMSTIINHEHIAWSACAQAMEISKEAENNNNNDTNRANHFSIAT